MQGNAPVLVLQPVMGSLPTSENKDAPDSTAETHGPFGPLILPIAPPSKGAQIPTLTLPLLPSLGSQPLAPADNTNKQQTSSQGSFTVHDMDSDLSVMFENQEQQQKQHVYSTAALEQELETCEPEKEMNFSLNSAVTSDKKPANLWVSADTDYDKWEQNGVLGLENKNGSFDDVFAMDFSDLRTPPNTISQALNAFNSTNPFAKEMESKVKVYCLSLVLYKLQYIAIFQGWWSRGAG